MIVLVVVAVGLALAVLYAGATPPARKPGAVFGGQPWPPRNRTPRK